MTRKARQPSRSEPARAAVETAAAQQDGHLPSELTLSNGIVLALRPIPPGIIERALARLEKPKVPRWKNPDKDVEEENPGDPEYVAALEAYQLQRNVTAANTLLLVGTAMKEIPEGLYGPEEVGLWFDQELMAHLGIEANTETNYDRYLAWLELYAMAKQGDILAVFSILNRIAGIGEEDVQAAVAGFRGRTARRADSDVPAEAP